MDKRKYKMYVKGRGGGGERRMKADEANDAWS